MRLYQKGKLILLAAALIVTLLLAAACDNGLKFTQMELVSAPRTEYAVGESTLDFAGGKIRLTSLDGTTEERDLQEYTYHKANDKYPCITSDVNLSVPGEYTVTIWQTEELSCRYTILVQAANLITD